MDKCYWYDSYGTCWTLEQVKEYWNNLGYEYPSMQPIQQAQQIHQQVKDSGLVSIQLNDIVVLASQHWWLVAIFLVGIVTMGIAGYRIFSKSKLGSELVTMWFGRKGKDE